MFCRQCGNEIPDEAAICVKCGVATVKHPVAVSGAVGKSKTTYILFAVLLGLLGVPGIHNLYAGYTSKGLVQLLCSVLSCGILWIPMYIWAIIEACTVEVDAAGDPMV